MAERERRRRKTPQTPTAVLRARIAALEVRATAAKKADRARRETETRYRVLAEQSSLGIVIHKDFIVRYAWGA